MSVLERSTMILDMLSHYPGKALTVGEIADSTGIPNATCCRLLQQLRDLGWVDQNGQRANYRLGPRSFALGGGEPYRPKVVAAARNVMTKLARAWQDSGIILAVLQDQGQAVIWECGAYDTSTVKAQIRFQEPWHGPAGRVLVANLTSNQRMRWINRTGLPNEETWPGIVSRKELLDRLGTIRRQGYATQYNSKGQLRALATLIQLPTDGNEKTGRTHLSLGMFFPGQSIATQRIHDLKNAAMEITRNYALDNNFRTQSPNQSSKQTRPKP